MGIRADTYLFVISLWLGSQLVRLAIAETLCVSLYCSGRESSEKVERWMHT